MFKRIEAIKNKGYVPTHVFDIGAHHGMWTNAMRHIYPDADYYMFEAIDYGELAKFKRIPKTHVFAGTLLNDKIEEVDWYEERNTGDSFFKELSIHFKDTKPIKRMTTTLDVLDVAKDAKNIFMKIDCQGAEIPILKGASTLLSRTDFILAEIPLYGQYNEGVPTFLEHIQFMESIGFIPFDICEQHYVNGYTMQVDMIFINKNRQDKKI